MAAIKEDYISYEVAKLLKEKGFHEPCIATYNSITKNFNVEKIYYDWTINWKDFISAPTQAMAMKWLREVHHYHINIIQQWLPKGYRFSIENLNKGYFYTICGSDVYKTYEEACEEALKFCLKKLI